MKVTIRTFDFNSADIPSASGCLSCPDFTRTAQLVQQPVTYKSFSERTNLTSYVTRPMLMVLNFFFWQVLE